MAKELEKTGYQIENKGEYFHEFVTRMPRHGEVLKALAEADILGGLPVGEDLVLWCATEKVARADLDKTVAIVKEVLAR